MPELSGEREGGKAYDPGWQLAQRPLLRLLRPCPSQPAVPRKQLPLHRSSPIIPDTCSPALLLQWRTHSFRSQGSALKLRVGPGTSHGPGLTQRKLDAPAPDAPWEEGKHENQVGFIPSVILLPHPLEGASKLAATGHCRCLFNSRCSVYLWRHHIATSISSEA